MGNGALASIDAGRADPSQRSMVNAGRICGIIGTILMVLYIVGYGIELATGMAGHRFGSYY